MPSLLSSVRQGRQEGRAAIDETIINATIEIITLFTAHRSGSVDDCIRSHKPLDFSCKFSSGWNSLIIPRSCSSSRFRLSTIQQQSNVVAGRGRRFVCWLFQVVRYSLPSSSCRPQQTSFVGFFHSNSNSVLFFFTFWPQKRARFFVHFRLSERKDCFDRSDRRKCYWSTTQVQVILVIPSFGHFGHGRISVAGHCCNDAVVSFLEKIQVRRSLRNDNFCKRRRRKRE